MENKQGKHVFQCSDLIIPQVNLSTKILSALLVFSFLLNTFLAFVLYKSIYRANKFYYNKSMNVLEQIHNVQISDDKVLPTIHQ